MPQGTATLTFSDEFNSLNLWNGSTGTWSTNFWWSDPKGPGSTLAGNGEQQWYINADYAPTASVKPWTVDNGVLTLTAAPAAPEIQALVNGYEYTSGELNTFHTFSQTFGYFEMRAELPAGQGAWPAFWLLPASGGWPPELDIFEVLGNEPDKIYTTVHTMETGSHTSNGLGSVVADTSVGYHTYGVDWEADTITWYYDGKAVYQIATPADMHQAMYMVTNLAVGGYWPGMVDASTPLPAHMNIDYVHVYTSMPTDAAAAAAAAAAVTSATAATAEQAATGGVKLIAHAETATILAGGTGNDTLSAGYTSDTLTGGAGADTFVFTHLPWNAGHVTDFTVGVDKLDLSALFSASGYQGSAPVADGYLILQSDGAGGTKVLFDVDGRGTANPWPITITTLDHVSSAGLTSAQLMGGPVSVAAAPAAPAIPVAPAAPAIPVAAPVVPAAPAAPAAPLAAPTPGQTLAADPYAPTVLTGGAGADTLTAGHNADVLTGGAGADTFDFNVLPWNASHITDFTPGVDKLDLTTIASAAGYHGGVNAVADGYLSFRDDGHGGTQVYFDTDGHAAGNPWPFLITTLDHVAPSSVHASDWVI